MRETFAAIVLFASALTMFAQPAASMPPKARASYDHTRYSVYCHFLRGPRTGQYGDMRPQPPRPIGARCTDGMGSEGEAGWRPVSAETQSKMIWQRRKSEVDAFVGAFTPQATSPPPVQSTPPPDDFATPPRVPAPPAVGAAAPSSSLPGEGTFGPGLLGTEFAGPNTYLGPPPTVTLFLKPYNAARNLAVCDSFKSIPTAEHQRESAKLLPNVLALRWILSQDVADFTNCQQLVGAYDFYRAGALLAGIVATTSHADGSQADISGQGPFLVEQFSDANGQHYVFVDFSKSADGDFKDLGPMIIQALATQAELLRAGTAAAPGPAAPTNPGSNTSPAPAKPELTGFAKWACPFIENPIVKMIEAGLSLLPAGKIGVSVWDAGANPLCGVTPGQGGASSAATPASSAAATSKKK